MRLLNQKESKLWLRKRGLDIELISALRPIVPLEADSGAKTALARAVVETFFSNSETLLFVSEHGVWPSSEMPFVFEIFRSALVGFRPLSEEPGAITEPAEREFLTGMLALALYFIWDVIVVDDGAKVVFFASHDENYTLANLDPSAAESVAEFLSPTGS